MEANPFPEAEAEPPVDADLPALEALAAPTERFRLANRVLYLYTPDGFGRSKLTSRAEALLGVPATARNWRTITRLRKMIEGDG